MPIRCLTTVLLLLLLISRTNLKSKGSSKMLRFEETGKIPILVSNSKTSLTLFLNSTQRKD